MCQQCTDIAPRFIEHLSDYASAFHVEPESRWIAG